MQAQARAFARADSAAVETGQAFRVYIGVSSPGAAPLGLDLTPWRPYFPPENILNVSEWLRSDSAWFKELTLIAFEADTLMLPALELFGAAGDTLRTLPLAIQVYPTPAPKDVAQIADISDIRRTAARWTDYLPWLWAAAILSLLGLLGFWLLRKKPVALPPPPAPALPAHVLALQALDALHYRQLPQHGHIKAYYTDLSYIIRQYLETRYHAPILESGSNEAVQHLKKAGFNPALLPDLEDLLQQSDLVKFAKGMPAPEYHELAMRKARHLIERTLEPQPL